MKAKEPTRRTYFSITSVTEELGKDMVSRNSYLLAIVAGIVVLIVTLLIINKLPRRIPLLLTNPWGEERLVTREWLFAGPALIWGVVTFNLLLAKSWKEEGMLVPRVLAIGSLTVAIMIMTALWGMLQSFFL